MFNFCSPRLGTLLVGVALATSACADSAGDAQSVPVDYTLLVEGNTAFACDIYTVLAPRDGNIFLSPYSIATALAMAREGAQGQTRRQMDAVLHLPPTGATEAFGALAGELEPPAVSSSAERGQQPTSAYELTTANALWGQEGLDFEKDFLGRLEAAFGSGLERVDFRDSERARAKINAWVEHETGEKILDLVPPGLPLPDTRLVLANAIYFKAAWTKPFSEHATADMVFNVAADRAVTTAGMRQTEEFPYGEVDDVQILEMSYRGAETALIVALPRANDGIGDLGARLDADLLASWVASLERRRVAVTLPKFTFTAGTPLKEPLRALGMHDAFDAASADFSGMTNEEKLLIGAVLHKAFIAVDEAGTEAAAATAVTMTLTSAPPRTEPVPFVADHPFLFFIRHRPTGTVLFLGRVSDPTGS